MSRHIRAGWETALLVCGKCSKKLDGGFGPKGKTSLAKALKKELGAKSGRKSTIGIVEVKCLGICPKHAVTLIDARNSREWLIVKQGADMGELAAELGLGG